jgi:hypothetical protein
MPSLLQAQRHRLLLPLAQGGQVIIGFTGTREGTATEQRAALQKLLRERKPTEVHHGDCDGADEQFHSDSIDLGVPKIVIHPGHNYQGLFPTRSYCDQHTPGDGKSEITVLPAKPYLVRDRDIVMATELLIACPQGQEKLRSGTWTTVRAARKANRPIIIIFPDGSVVEENF